MKRSTYPQHRRLDFGRISLTIGSWLIVEWADGTLIYPTFIDHGYCDYHTLRKASTHSACRAYFGNRLARVSLDCSNSERSIRQPS